MSRSARTFIASIFILASSCFGWVLPAGAQIAAPRPHILYIITDDQGWKDVGFHGSDIMTPQIDKLAQQGARFEQFYAQPMSTGSGGPWT